MRIITANGFNNTLPERKNFRNGRHFHLKNQTIRHVFNKTIPTIELGQQRQEEPQYGALMLTDSLDTFDQYITGNSRRLFAHPSVHIVILVSAPFGENDRNMAGHIMRSLWTDFWVVHAFIVFMCEEEEVIPSGIQCYWRKHKTCVILLPHLDCRILRSI